MAHFAELDNNNYVTRVIVVDNASISDASGNESEELGIQFCHSLLGGKWLQTSYNGNFRNKFAAINDYYDSSSDSFISPWWKNASTGKDLTADEWKYIENYKHYTTTFRLWAAIPADQEQEWLTKYCNSTSLHAYVPLDYLTHGTYKLKTDVGDIISFDENNNMSVKIHFTHTKVVDLGDVGVVMEEWTDFFDYDIARRARQLHPQVAASSAHELFRLLLEWDFCYEQLGNREPAAQRCHDAVGYLGMPDDVKQELMDLVPDQAVARYIKGQEPFVGPSDVPCPPLFKEWYNSISVK
jgi:hypothetical protein